MATNKKNSLPITADQQLRAYQNNAEILSGLSAALSSEEAHVRVETVNPISGERSSTELPSIGSFQARVQRLEDNLALLTGMNGNAVTVRDGQANSYRRVILADVNLEPNDITAVDQVAIFKPQKNLFFDALLNPLLMVEFDLTGKVQQNVRKVLSRRFIVEFQKDAAGEYTAAAKARIQEFDNKYKGKNNIEIGEFVEWYSTQPGIMNQADLKVDVEQFDLEPHRLKYNGAFTVLGTELDTVNRKLWYKLNTLNYQDIGNAAAAPVTRTLAVGDEAAVVPSAADQTSTTVYRVAEISTVTTDLRVRFDRITGAEPIPVQTNALKMYSPVVYDKRVRVSVGYDEYNVIFLKPLAADNHLLAKNWSKGTGFYTNELREGTATGMTLGDFYEKVVLDYGAVLDDLVAKKVPTSFGVLPLPPNLVVANFKVVELNKHLTNTADTQKVQQLYQQVNTYKKQIDQLNVTVQSKQRAISTTQYKGDADRKADLSELAGYQEQERSKSELMASILKKIIEQQKNVNDIKPKFEVRGMWAMPNAVTVPGSVPQEVVQFEYQWRYSSKSGSMPNLEQFVIEPPLSESTDTAARGLRLSGAAASAKTVSGAFSNWNTQKSDHRVQYQDPVTGTWKWRIEDVTSADTPNINQIKVAISPGEKVDIRVRSLSEVGWPEAPLTSEWSEPITVEFPDDLSSVLPNSQFILQEATQEEQRVRFIKELDGRGLTTHLSTSFNTADRYFAHSADAVASGFFGGADKMLSLFEKLTEMQTRIDKLEEAAKRLKGELRVRLIYGAKEWVLTNGEERVISIDMETIAEPAQVGVSSAPVTPLSRRSYVNATSVVKDLSIVVENYAKESPLSLLSTRLYGEGASVTSTPFAFSTASNLTAQATWVDDEDNILHRQSANGTLVRTQFDNQWIWLQNTKVGGATIYTTGYAPDTAAGSTDDTPVAATLHAAVVSTGATEGNLGYSSNLVPSPAMATIKLTDPAIWAATSGGSFAASAHPKVNSQDDIIETGTDKVRLIEPGSEKAIVIPLHLYWKFNTAKVNYSATPVLTAVTSGASTVLTVGSSHGIAAGDEVVVTGSSLTGLNNTPHKVKAVDSTTVTISYNSTGGGTVTTPGTLSAVAKRAQQSAGVEVFTYYTFGSETAASDSVFRISTSSATPLTLNRTVRFFMEPENASRPFQFSVNFKLRQFSVVAFNQIDNSAIS